MLVCYPYDENCGKSHVHISNQKIIPLSGPTICIPFTDCCESRDRRDQNFWYDTDIDTFAGSKSIPRLIPILSISLNRDRYWHWYQKNVPGLILIPRLYLIRNCCIWPKNWCRCLNWYRYWYPDPRNAPIETDTDTTALGIGVFDTIPIFPSVSGLGFG